MQLIANMATIIIPEIALELNISVDMQLWINAIYLCTLVAFAIPLASIMSQYGIKRSVKASCIIMLVSLLLMVFSVDFYMVLIARFLQGLSCAAL